MHNGTEATLTSPLTVFEIIIKVRVDARSWCLFVARLWLADVLREVLLHLEALKVLPCLSLQDPGKDGALQHVLNI